jgi:DNA-directed RNA polymerase subunit RPC12/RpoP
MTIKFRCLECGSRAEADSADIGLTGHCPRCGVTLKVPAESEPSHVSANPKPRRSFLAQIRFRLFGR